MTSGFIYAFKVGPYIKIGYATDWKRRFKNYETHCPFKISKVIVRAVPKKMAKSAEAMAHAQLAHGWHRGEWFEVSKAEAMAAIKTAWKAAHKLAPRTPELETLKIWYHERYPDAHRN